MKTTHTPGPWTVRTPDHFVDGLAHMIISEHPQEGYWHVAEMGTHNGREVSAANARLIAAAPELLSALESLFEHCSMVHKRWGDGSNQKEADAAIEAARAAIAKAEGGGQ